MRQITFRGKRLDNGEWVYGNLLHSSLSTRVVNCTEGEEYGIRKADYDYHNVDPDTVGQFTGLADKGGKDIYEGDIVRFKGEFYRVRFQNGMFYAAIISKRSYGGFPLHALTVTADDDCVCEVIGNVYDDKSLLL